MKKISTILLQIKIPQNIVLVLITTFVIYSCKQETTIIPDIETNSYLVSDTLVKQYTLAEIQQLVGFFKLNPDFAAIPGFTALIDNKLFPALKYGIKVYKITYNSILPNNTKIVLSGAIAVPDTTSSAYKLASYQHPTISSQNDAPSNYGNFNLSTGLTTQPFVTPTASAGYVVSCPDYIGFGISKNSLETYAQPHLGIVSADMLKAVKEFLNKRNYRLVNDSATLFGYSEGGLATMGLHKTLESTNQQPVRLSMCGSGPYIPFYLGDSVFKQNMPNPSLGFYVKFLWCYNNYYIQPMYPLSFFTNAPYTNVFQTNAIVTWPYLTTPTITDSVKLLFNNSFRTDWLNRVAPIIQNFYGLRDNNVYNFKPKSPITLFQGGSDNLVFPFAADSAYNAIIRNGGNYVNLDLQNNIKYLVPGYDHSTGIGVFLYYLYNKIF
ncbi:MAG: lipase family protein [Alphaproteobacteria bacterium]|nr:lipase family protein [Alphaproteobacteria bacterium]